MLRLKRGMMAIQTRPRGSFLKRKTGLAVLFLTIMALFAAASHPSQSSGKWTTESLLTMMDRSAQDFRSLTADIEHVKYTAVVQDTSTETGEIYVRRDQKMRIDITKPDPKTILRTGDALYIFTPKINRVEEYDLGKNRAMADQYARLGFGTRSDELVKSYDVKLAGEEDLDQHKTLVMELTPKSDEVRRQIPKIQMWIDESSWLPVQQKFFETTPGDYFLSHFTNMMKNLKIPDSRFKPDWPKNAQRVKPHI